MDHNPAILYGIIAYNARKAGVITQEELNLIRRPGSRKAPYWDRHLRDLCEVLKGRQLPDGVKKLIEEVESEKTPNVSI